MELRRHFKVKKEDERVPHRVCGSGKILFDVISGERPQYGTAVGLIQCGQAH